MSDPVSALVLAGGKSRRLGVDKASISLGGSEVSLLASTVAALKAVADEVLVVIGEGERPEVGDRIVRDVYPGKGSLGGVYSGLLACRHEHGLVVACDMPFLNVDLLAYMVSLPRDYDVLIPRLGDALEPLHAIYAKTCLPYMKNLLDRDHLKIIDFFDEVKVRYVETAEIDKLDPRRLSFFNVNTPEQLTRARAIAEERAPRES